MTTDLSPHAVGQPITDGIRTVNFFNGRLLAAGDLKREQEAGRRLRQRLGRAVGEGVVEGLEVQVSTSANTPSNPVVAVRAGTAITRSGVALELPRDVLVSLSRAPGAGSTPTTEARPSSAFAPCSALAQGAPFTVSGIYVLTVSPAEVQVGSAPVSGLGNEAASCNTDSLAEGVAFGLIHLNLPQEVLADEAHLRNRVAHLMYGTEDLSNPEHPRRVAVVRDPFGPRSESYGLLEDLRGTCLCDDDVPLAVIFWTPGPGIRFVDMWSVRRRVIRPPSASRWGEFVGDRRLAEGEAMFLQFQDELAEVGRDPTRPPETLQASTAFRYLPAVGLLPLGSTSVRGFRYDVFFSGVPTRGPAVMEGAHLEDLLRQSLAFPPIDLSRHEAMWLYETRENLMPTTDTSRAVQAAMLFSSGHIPYRADGRFDLSYWNYANFAEIG